MREQAQFPGERNFNDGGIDICTVITLWDLLDNYRSSVLVRQLVPRRTYFASSPGPHLPKVFAKSL